MVDSGLCAERSYLHFVVELGYSHMREDRALHIDHSTITRLLCNIPAPFKSKSGVKIKFSALELILAEKRKGQGSIFFLDS